MTSIFDNPYAFDPFFDDIVSVEGRIGDCVVKTGAIPACVFDQGLDDPLSDEDTHTNRRRFSVTIRACDWPEVDGPRIGFTLELADGRRLAVDSVSVVQGDYQIEARTC